MQNKQWQRQVRKRAGIGGSWDAECARIMTIGRAANKVVATKRQPAALVLAAGAASSEARPNREDP
jgi:hypothetical protein